MFKLLDPVLNIGLRPETGLLRETPTQVLFRVDGVPPLALRREQAILRCIGGYPSRYLNREKQSEELNEVYRWLPTRSSSTSVSVLRR